MNVALSGLCFIVCMCEHSTIMYGADVFARVQKDVFHGHPLAVGCLKLVFLRNACNVPCVTLSVMSTTVWSMTHLIYGDTMKRRNTLTMTTLNLFSQLIQT